MSDVKKQFEARLGRFGRVRRAVKNGALAYGLAFWRWALVPAR